jgi:hypothetical protein
MPPVLRFIAALAALLALSSPAASRDAKPNAPKVVPKIGAINAFTSAAQLASMLAGPGVTISNAKFTGSPLAAGTFGGGQVDLGLDSGVVLSTGNAADVQGPNSDTGWTTDFGLPGDPDLTALVGDQTFDAAVLEFDVTPAGSTIAVRYVFASEEYNEYVGSPFNDVMAIYVNGINCANINGRPVSVNTINADVNGGLFVDNTTGVLDTQMDGLTTPLDCVAAVTPGVANHVKIAIADTSDGRYDSALFIAASGIRSPGIGGLTLSPLLKAVEYHHAEWDHYFITTIPVEIQKLDDGTFVGWARTGLTFNVYVTGTANTADVCRFFSTSFAPRSSHFYTPFAAECATVKQNPNWQFEAVVFGMVLPNADATCTAGTKPLYRVYNNGMGGAPNHRYTTEPDIFASMQSQGWTPEGAGVGVIACVPI